jgi:hypothetical protein
VSPDATLTIAASWQALARAETDDEQTMICNCTVMIEFAAFFIEANLNHVLDAVGKTQVVKRDLGLQKKLGYFYNPFIAASTITNRE